jgi:hypothetical protein
MPANQKQPAVTVNDLGSPPKSETDRFFLFERYCKQKPSPAAIPFLRRALGDSYHAVVKCAAHSLRKLGPVAHEAMPDLLAAAARVDGPTGMPQAYPQCVEAMAAIDPKNPELVALIKNFVGLDNWVPISASLRALKKVGTPEAKDLLHRTAAFWMPELNKMQRRVVEQLLADDGDA